MTTIDEEWPVFALVDDQVHSARLMTRTMIEADSPARVIWLGDARRAKRSLQALLDEAAVNTPDMIIVDLKTHSGATAEFISEIGNLKAKADVPVAAIAASLDAESRNAILGSGADAVFERHHDLVQYRKEMAQLTSFWVRETATWPIRA